MRRFGLTVHFDDGTAWPTPGLEMNELQWRLRYADFKPDGDKLSAASVVSAYEALIALPIRERNRRITQLRKARGLPSLLASPTPVPPTTETPGGGML